MSSALYGNKMKVPAPPPQINMNFFLTCFLYLKNHRHFKGMVENTDSYSLQNQTQFLPCDRYLICIYWLTQALNKHFLIDQHFSRECMVLKCFPDLLREVWGTRCREAMESASTLIFKNRARFFHEVVVIITILYADALQYALQSIITCNMTLKTIM